MGFLDILNDYLIAKNKLNNLLKNCKTEEDVEKSKIEFEQFVINLENLDDDEKKSVLEKSNQDFEKRLLEINLESKIK